MKSAKGKGVERDQEPSSELARQSVLTTSYGQVLSLQRNAGNRAVSELLDAESSKNAFPGDDSQRQFQASNNGQIEAHSNGARGHPLLDARDCLFSEPAPQPDVSAPSAAKAPTTGGHPLDPLTRREMESGFGADFSHVRLHTDVTAQQHTMVADSAALTEGAHIYLGRQYRPGTARGRSLLAHELTHVRQQSLGPISMTGRGQNELEREAREVGSRVAGGGKAGIVAAGTAPHGIPQADAAGEHEIHVRGKAGEKGIGMLFVEGWNKLTPLEKESIRAFAREMDFEASQSGITRQKVDARMRALANRTAQVSRQMLGLGSGAAGGHLPDVTAGQKPVAPVAGMPSRVNSSFGGQWRRYEHGFTFTGVSIYDADTGQWVYESLALEHAPPPAPKGRPPTPPPAAKAAKPPPAKKATTTPPLAKKTTATPPPAKKATAAPLPAKKPTATPEPPSPQVAQPAPTAATEPTAGPLKAPPTTPPQAPPLTGPGEGTPPPAKGTPPPEETKPRGAAPEKAGGPGGEPVKASGPGVAPEPSRPVKKIAPTVKAAPAPPEPTAPVKKVTPPPPGKTAPTVTPAPAASKTTTITKARTTVDVDASGPRGTVKLNNIDLADYPPDRPGPVTRFFKDRPVVRQFASTAASMGASYAKGKAFELIQSHFQSSLGEARNEFARQFPDAATLKQKARIDELKKSYSEALLRLKTPDRRRVLVKVFFALGPEKGIDVRMRAAEQYLARMGDTRAADITSYRDAAAVYANAMADVVTEVSKDWQALSPDIAKDLRQRASVLLAIGADLEDTFWKIVNTGLVAFPNIEDEAFSLYSISEIFNGLGASMADFAHEVESRESEYANLYRELDEELMRVTDLLGQLNLPSP